MERARWIVYEQIYEEEADRWSNPHVSSLSFNSVGQLKKYIQFGKSADLLRKVPPSFGNVTHNGAGFPGSTFAAPASEQYLLISTRKIQATQTKVILLSGTVLLDADEEVLPDIAGKIADKLVEDNQIDSYSKNAVKWALKLRHRYHVSKKRK